MAGTTVDATINLMGVDQYLTESVHLTRPFGHIVNVGGNDDHFPIRRLQSRAQSLDWELMFTKSKYGYELDSQGEILSHVLQLLVDGTIHHTTTTIIRGGIDAAHLNQARTQLETGHQAGKIVITRA
ncbi:zinc-binding dehydrogenase [Lacticaseibacillus thailandensis]|nr:zinc-binding dehydrogenase [Lacticaseibacillus thailandensis]